MFDNQNFDKHEQVVFVQDEGSGLQAVIAIHSTRLGPAAGGCRLWSYDSAEMALNDALRLSRGMSFKNALAGLPFGGGKAVIMGPVTDAIRPEAFEAFGRVVQNLAGRYVTAEDVGVRVVDMRAVASQTEFVSGLNLKSKIGGDPSPHTAKGVRIGIEAAAAHVWGRTDLNGLRVAVQGLGGVGSNLCRELRDRGASLVVSDPDPQRVAQVCDLGGAEVADLDQILFSDVDVIAPCALGSVITQAVAKKVSARLVAGGANNQLADPGAGKILAQRGVAYVPDYLLNAGGIIMVSAEYLGESDAGIVDEQISRIGDRTREVLLRAKHEGRLPEEIADQKAREIMAASA